jgi:hypothetical protein
MKTDLASYLPVSLISVGVAWTVRKLRPIILQVFIAIIVPSLASAILAIALELINPSTPGEGGMGWTIILAASWAIVAVPVCLISVIIFNLLQRQARK